MMESKWNFERIRNAVDSADRAQEAGYDDLCHAILKRLASELPAND